MRVLIGYSTCPLTRKAFEAHGHEVWTCDLLPARDEESDRRHLECDIWFALEKFRWDFGVFHPMCTCMNIASAWAYKDPDFDKHPDGGYHMKLKPGTLTGAARREAREREVSNFKKLQDLKFPVVCENPAPSFLNTAFRPPTQIVHPHQFGDDASKSTGLWMNDRRIPLLHATRNVPPRWVMGKAGKPLPRWANQTDSGQNNMTPSESRWLDRSATYPGIAAAFGDQWGRWLNGENHFRLTA